MGYKKYGIKDIQRRLNAHGFNLKVDGIFGEKTKKAVLDFQYKNKLYADGIVGAITWRALQERPFEKKKIEKLKFVEVECDVWTADLGSKTESGYSRTILREDCVESFIRVRDTLREKGGQMTSSGGRRWLDASVGSNRSKTSNHYLGRAHDLYVNSMGINPENDPYVIENLGNKELNIWARCNENKGVYKELDVITYDLKEHKIKGWFLDLTTLFKENGWEAISPRSSFWRGNKMGAETWHFQMTKNLIPGKSTFGEELLKTYNEKELQKYALWQYRNFRWQKEWF